MRKPVLTAAGAAVLAIMAALAVPSLAAAATVPKSPDGIQDARLCGSRNFEVQDGNVDHVFTFKSAVYITGGTQRSWNEERQWFGLNTGGYNFHVDCY